MLILKFLQHNAEWMCAIAIVGFTAVQCWLAYQQNIQIIRMKRLELAHRLDEVAAQFLGQHEEASYVSRWLVANASNFAFLLNAKDIEKYKRLANFMLNYTRMSYEPSTEEKIEVLKTFLELVGQLDFVLGNAKYGFVEAGKEFESTNKGTEKCE